LVAVVEDEGSVGRDEDDEGSDKVFFLVTRFGLDAVVEDKGSVGRDEDDEGSDEVFLVARFGFGLVVVDEDVGSMGRDDDEGSAVSYKIIMNDY
jgi:hypothetical protein